MSSIRFIMPSVQSDGTGLDGSARPFPLAGSTLITSFLTPSK